MPRLARRISMRESGGSAAKPGACEQKSSARCSVADEIAAVDGHLLSLSFGE